MRDKLLLTNGYYKPTTLNLRNPIKEINEIVCAKNECPSLAIIIDSRGKAIRYVGDGSPSLGIYKLERYRIYVDAPFDYTLRPVGYVKNNDDVKIADIIYDSTSMEYQGDELPFILCDFTLPKNIKSGSYVAVVKLFVSNGLNDEELAYEKSVTITVKDVLLPLPSEYTLYNDIWQHNCNVARTFGVELWSDKHFELIGKVLDKLVMLGQKSATIVASDCPWRGWGCYLMRDKPANAFEYSCIRVYLKNGKFTYDFSILDRIIQLYVSKGIDGDVSLFGLIGIWKMPFFNTAQIDYPEQIKIRYIDTNDNSIKYMKRCEDVISYISALFQHLYDIGIWNKVRIAADEPSDVTAFKENLKILQSIRSDLKLKLAIDKPEVIASLSNLVDTLAYSFPCTIDNYKTNVSYGKKLYYVCNIPDRPNSQLNNSITDNIATILLNHVFGMDGFLRWAFTCWTINPLKDIRYNTSSIPAGDMNLIYPSTNGEMLESIRYRAFYKGIIIYELLEKIKTIDYEKFKSLLSKIINTKSDSYMINDDIGISQNADDYISTYNQILTYLEKVD